MRSTPPAGAFLLLPLLLLLLLLAYLAAAVYNFDKRGVCEPACLGAGVWVGLSAARPADREVAGLAVVGDWWDGPGDVRAGDAKLSAMPGVLYEVRRGDGPWVALPPADRDLRLVVRAEAPPDAKDLLGASPEGAWSVRQKAGGAYPHALRIEFTCRGDRLLVKDLRVKSLSLPDLDPKPVVGRPHLPDRTENRVLKLGDAVAAVVVVENCGARKTKEVDVDLLAAPVGVRKGPRLGHAQVPALEPGGSAEVRIDGTLPEDLSLEGGIFEIVAVLDPRGVEREVELFNNVLTRAFRLSPPEDASKLPDDLRNR